ncbi:hypothetical protein LguiA_036121 [Lonicera macranthoides]
MAISFSSSTLTANTSKLFHYPLKSHKKPNKFTLMATQKDPITTTTTCSFYELLSLSTNEADIEEIKKAYRTMALKYHPDVCPNSENAKVFILLNTAYKTLSDPILRKKYDNKMRLGDFGCTYEEEFGNWDLRGRWEDQLLELKSRSSFRVAKKEGSWGCRLRGRNKQNRVM